MIWKSSVMILGGRILSPTCKLGQPKTWGLLRNQNVNGCTRRYFRGKSNEQTQRLATKKTTLLPESESFKGEYSSPTIGRLIRPLGFTVMFCGCSFAGAAIWQYEVMRKRAIALWYKSSNWMKEQTINTKFGVWRRELNQRWNGLSEGERLALCLIGMNTFVFMLWRIPGAQSIMRKYFCSNPAAKAVCWPMVLSTFSHYSLWHLAANMYVLFSLTSSLVAVMGKEQFLAMYLSAGVCSSMTSYLFKTVTMKPGLSLGASGCLMGVLGFFCTQFPSAHLAIVFLPMVTFSADIALKAIIAVDGLGILLGWKLFDHAAHLGGVFFGIAYSLWGREHIWEKREPFLRWWNELREGTSK